MLMKIEFKKPTGATIEDVAAFVLDALTSCGGQYHPEDPMFGSIQEIEYVIVHGKKFVPEKET